jgi:uncharacterized protein involved in exopolysaccharide biosynthesis
MQHIEDNSQDTSSPVSDPEVASRTSAHAPDTINLLDLLEVIAKRWRMIAKVMVVTCVLSAGLSLLKKNIYSGTAMVIPPQKDSLLGMMGAMFGGTAGGGMGGGISGMADLLGKGTTADLYVGMLNSRAISDRIIDRFKLMKLYDIEHRLDTYKALDKNVDISAGKKDGIISITVEDEDPKRAANMANAYVEELTRLLVRLNITGAGENRGFLDERLTKAKADLTKAEEALKSFQAKNKALDVPAQAQATITGVAELKAQLAAQEVQLSALRSRFTDNAQEVKDMKTSIGNLRGQIAQLEGKGGASSSIPAVGSIPGLGQEYVRLMREFKVQEAVFELLTKQKEMTELSEARDVAGIQVLQQATVPDKKVKPKRSIIVLLSTFASGFGALLYAFILEIGQHMPPADRERWDRIRGILPNLSIIISPLRRRAQEPVE